MTSWPVSQKLWPAGPEWCCFPVLSTGETVPLTLCSIFGPFLQEPCGGAGAGPEKKKKLMEWSETQVLKGATKGTGAA